MGREDSWSAERNAVSGQGLGLQLIDQLRHVVTPGTEVDRREGRTWH